MSTAMPPETRATLQLGECGNANAVGADAVDNLIGEARDEYSTPVDLPPTRSRLWSLGDSVHCPANRVKELATKPGPLSLVPPNRVDQFLGRRPDCTDRSNHRPRVSLSMRFLTSSQDSDSTVPASIASVRRRISCSQADSAPASAGPSRLARTSAASSARSSGPRRKASASTALAALVMPGIVRSSRPPNNRVNATGRPVTPLDFARVAPVRLRVTQCVGGQRKKETDRTYRLLRHSSGS